MRSRSRSGDVDNVTLASYMSLAVAVSATGKDVQWIHKIALSLDDQCITALIEVAKQHFKDWEEGKQ